MTLSKHEVIFLDLYLYQIKTAEYLPTYTNLIVSTFGESIILIFFIQNTQ